MEEVLELVGGLSDGIIGAYLTVVRYVMPVLVIFLLCRCIRPLLRFKREQEIWAWLHLPGTEPIKVTHWENVLGRSKTCDLVVDAPTISRNHAVFTRYEDGSWSVADAGSKDGVYVNGRKVNIQAVTDTDCITIGGVDMYLEPVTIQEQAEQGRTHTNGSHALDSFFNLMLLSLVEMMLCLGLLLTNEEAVRISIFTGYGCIFACQWLLLLFYACIRRTSFEVETIAFFLCSMGMAVISTVAPGEAVKQVIAMVMGLAAFLFIGWSLRDLNRAAKIRRLAAVAGIGFLVITLLFGKEIYGAKNWLRIGGFSFQPSELSKVCFVFVGASTMDRLMNRRNLLMLIGYSVVLCGCLALMNDFGTALIFFMTFLVIAYMRSGSVGTIGLAVAALAFAGVLVLKIAPHAMHRFATYRHIWDDPYGGGYQQTRAIMCLAAGGLFGLGVGRGWLHNLFAADSDVAFATLSEEWGILITLMMVLCIVALAFFAVRSAAVGRSSFYTIGACTAASILLVQTILNVMGTLDLVPLTGVTFPFVSNGGSSMISAWGLLAFVKAADTRRNASFAVRLPRLRRVRG